MLTSPQAVRNFLRVKLGALEHEVFAVLMLDAQNRLIEYVELFRGTVSQASVYPREVVKEPLAFNAAVRKDGGKQEPAQIAAPNQPKPQRAPNLGIRSAFLFSALDSAQ